MHIMVKQNNRAFAPKKLMIYQMLFTNEKDTEYLCGQEIFCIL